MFQQGDNGVQTRLGGLSIFYGCLGKFKPVTFRAAGVLLKGLQATIPLEGVSTKVRKLLSRLEDDTESTSWRRRKESKKRGEECSK